MEATTEQNYVLNELELMAGAFAVFQELGDWDSAEATFYTLMDFAWRQVAQTDLTAPLRCPVKPRRDWAMDYLEPSR